MSLNGKIKKVKIRQLKTRKLAEYVRLQNEPDLSTDKIMLNK